MAREVNGIGNAYHKRSSIATPYGEGRTLYPFDLSTDPAPELALLRAIVRRAQADARWLSDLDRRPPETWSAHEKRRRGRMLEDGVVHPTDWLRG